MTKASGVSESRESRSLGSLGSLGVSNCKLYYSQEGNYKKATPYAHTLASTEVYPKTCSLPSLPKPTSYHALFMTTGTKPVVASCGGYHGDGPWLNSCVVWDSDKKRWDQNMMSALPDIRRGQHHSAVTIENVGVYILGGIGWNSAMSKSDFLPANSLQWIRGPGLPSDVTSWSTGCAVPVSCTSFIFIRFGVIREYKIDLANPTSDQGWMDAKRWPAIPRRLNFACARTEKYVLIAGGNVIKDKRAYTKGETYILDIATRKVRLGGNLVTPRYNHNLATVTTGGLTKTFALGGNRSGGKYLSTVEEWDEDNLKWKPAGNLKVARSEFAAITVPLSVVCPGSG